MINVLRRLSGKFYLKLILFYFLYLARDFFFRLFLWNLYCFSFPNFLKNLVWDVFMVRRHFCNWYCLVFQSSWRTRLEASFKGGISCNRNVLIFQSSWWTLNAWYFFSGRYFWNWNCLNLPKIQKNWAWGVFTGWWFFWNWYCLFSQVPWELFLFSPRFENKLFWKQWLILV